jgi:hypothetical protein
MGPTRLILIVAFALIATETVASAQSAAPAPRLGTLPAAWRPSPVGLHRLAPAGPTDQDPLSAAVAPSTSLAVAKVGQGGRKEAVALMVVGAAGIVTGLIANEDILVIAGAGVGGFGLYLYLR